MVAIKAIIPLAGKGTRLRPHTYSKPKPLLHVAGKPVLGHILDSLKALKLEEIIFITGDMEDQIVEYVGKNYSYKASFVKQDKLLGDGHAISLAKEKVKEDVIVVFVDTLFIKDIKQDIESIGNSDGIVWTSKTEDPKRFGIVELDNKIIIGIEEKPEKPKSNLAVIGLYYFKDADKMFLYLQKIRAKNLTSKGEYRLADALSLMIKEGVKLKAEAVDMWLDCGKPETILETNRYLLTNGSTHVAKVKDSVIRKPVYIEEGAVVENSVIGPYVSVAKGARITNSVISDAIIGDSAILSNAIIEESLIGNEADISFVKKRLNVGDSTQILGSQ